MARQRKPGRPGHGYEMRIEHVGQFLSEYHLVWGVGNDLPSEWEQFQREHIGDPTIHGAQIYRNSECRKNMAYRTIKDVFVVRDPAIPSWRK